jgi:hypothetical protein
MQVAAVICALFSLLPKEMFAASGRADRVGEVVFPAQSGCESKNPVLVDRNARLEASV